MENNVTQDVKMCVNTKCTQNHVCTHKNKQGVRNAQGDDFSVPNTGNIPHMLPVTSYNNNVKKCKQKGFITNAENLQKSSSGADKSKAFTSSRVNSDCKGKTSVDFVSHNKFSVLNDLQNDEITVVLHDSCATASEADIAGKVSRKNDGSCKKLNDGIESCVVHTSPVIDDKYNLRLTFRPRHRATIASATNVQTFKAWDSQTNDKFGFIPLGDFMLPQKNEKNQSNKSIFEIHDQIRESEGFNFMNSQIQVDSQLNADTWDKYDM